jgi:DNA-binding transcriptional ArsR family regulator
MTGQYVSLGTVNTKFPLASTAALIADPARAAMLTALLDGAVRSAGELAIVAGISAHSASMHLAQLLQGGFVKVSRDGRYRHYCLAGARIAQAVESLGSISTPQAYRPSGASQALCYARTCYDHLAGNLAVRLTAALERKRFIVAQGEREYELTAGGERFLRGWGIDVDELRRSRRNFARRCLDWTERREHLAGAVGAAICQKLMEFRWITRGQRSRAVHLSRTGERELTRLLA